MLTAAAAGAAAHRGTGELQPACKPRKDALRDGEACSQGPAAVSKLQKQIQQVTTISMAFTLPGSASGVQ